MKTLIFAAGAAALAIATPALANPAHGNHGSAHAQKSNATWHGHHGTSHHSGKRWHDSRHYAFDGRGRCPPGLAKKHNGCMPPGQARKMYNSGQRYDRHHGYRWSYTQIPTELRSRYRFDRDDRYYYRNGYIYQVDPRTMLVQQVVSALLR
jgi:hypothetical protein